MDDRSFKVTLVKALEHSANTDWTFGTDQMWEVIMTLPLIECYCGYTYRNINNFLR